MLSTFRCPLIELYYHQPITGRVQFLNPISESDENSNDCLFGGFASCEETSNQKSEKSLANEKPTTSTNQNETKKERPKRRYDPSNPPLFSKSEVFLRRVYKLMLSPQPLIG